MSDGHWTPLPPDVAEWMGMDDAMVPFAVDYASEDPSVIHQEAPSPQR